MSRSILFLVKKSLTISFKNIIYYFFLCLIFTFFEDVSALENKLHDIEKQERKLNYSIASLKFDDIKNIAKNATVQIEGNVPGVGVLVEREGIIFSREKKRYTVLTTWNVVANSKNNIITIITPDGVEHNINKKSIERIGNIDLAVLSFFSNSSYSSAKISDQKEVNLNKDIFISGFPFPESAETNRSFNFISGKLIANANISIKDGYQMMYSASISKGMKGSALFNINGELIGIHSNSILGNKIDEKLVKVLDIKINTGIPISYYKQFSKGLNVFGEDTSKISDDYLMQAKQLIGIKGEERKLIRLTTRSLELSESSPGYFYRAFAKDALKDYNGAIKDLDAAIKIDSNQFAYYFNRGIAKGLNEDHKAAISDFNKSIEFNSDNELIYSKLGDSKFKIGDFKGSIDDFSLAIEIKPNYGYAFRRRGAAKGNIDDIFGSIVDFSSAIRIDPNDYKAYAMRGDSKELIEDYLGSIDDATKAISINPKYAYSYRIRGLSNRRIGENKKAISDFTYAIDYDPIDKYSYAYRGVTFEKLDMLDKACADWREAAYLGHEESNDWVKDQCL